MFFAGWGAAFKEMQSRVDAVRDIVSEDHDPDCRGCPDCQGINGEGPVE
jgi:hypothetical protein